MTVRGPHLRDDDPREARPGPDAHAEGVDGEHGAQLPGEARAGGGGGGGGGHGGTASWGSLHFTDTTDTTLSWL